MIKFYFFIYKEKSCRNGGYYQFAKVYRLKNNKLDFCLNCEWSTSSYRGVKSEIFQNLIEKILYRKNGIIRAFVNGAAAVITPGMFAIII